MCKGDRILFEIGESVLQKLAFLFAYPAENVSASPVQEMIAAEVTFSGPYSGKVRIAITPDVLPEMAANMLGIEEDDTIQTTQHDALKELANVLCGNLLPRIFGKHVVFSVGLPQILEFVNGMKDDPKEIWSAETAFILDNGAARLFLYLDQIKLEEILEKTT